MILNNECSAFHEKQDIQTSNSLFIFGFIITHGNQ